MSPTRGEQYHSPSDFAPSPRSSISSSTFSATPSSSASPAHPPVQLPPGLFLDPSRSPPQQRKSPQSPPASLYPDSAHSFPGFGRSDSTTSNSSYDPNSLSATSTGTVRPSSTAATASTPAPSTFLASFHSQLDRDELTRDSHSTAVVTSSAPDEEHTQAALAEIFGGQVRPHFRSSSVVSPRAEVSPPESGRSYFSPPAPKSPSNARPVRPRSQSSAPALDPSFRHHAMNQSNGVFSGGQGGQQLQYHPQHHQQSADQYGYRPSSSNSNYSSSLPSNGANPIRISSAASNHEDRSPSRPPLGHFGGSYTGGNGAAGFDQTRWRSTGSRQAASFGWEDAEREGRGRSRDEQQRPWGESDFSHASGIGLSNMSPFTRDGGRTLADLGEGAAAYKARRDYSLGAVGSGRKRSDSEWGRDRTLKEAEDEDEDAFAPPTKSGATSRRHSFAAFNPPSRSQIGFNLPEEDTDRASPSNFGSSALMGGFGAGSSAINDDDLAADLNSLHLNLEAHVAAVDNKSRQQHEHEQQRLSHVGSMPTNFPPSQSSRRFEDSSSHSRSPPPNPNAPLRSPAAMGSASSSRFFQPQPPAPTTSITPSTASRMGSRFEFGSSGAGGGGSNGSGSLALGDFGLGAFGGGSQQGYGGGQGGQQQQQQVQNRYVPSFGLPTPSPPNSYYSSPLPAPSLLAQAPAFQGFPGQGPPPSHQQQHQPFYPSGGPQSQQQQQQQQMGTSPGASQSNELVNLGRGVPLHTVPANAPLYIVEFKAGRKDLFYVEDPNLKLRQGDLVIVEADRGFVSRLADSRLFTDR